MTLHIYHENVFDLVRDIRDVRRHKLSARLCRGIEDGHRPPRRVARRGVVVVGATISTMSSAEWQHNVYQQEAR